MYFSTPDRRVKRDRLPLNVRIGFSPTEPSRRQKTLPVLDTFDGDPIATAALIKSGMLIVADVGTYMGQAVTGWRAAQVADATSAMNFYVANGDYDSFDVQAAGGLTALALSDNYQFETSYFRQTVTNFTDSLALTAGVNGTFVAAVANDVIVAKVAEVGENANGSFSYSGATPSGVIDKYIVINAAHTGVEAA